MATGFTYGVKDGSITDLRGFALRCARSFGATVEFREESLDMDLESRIDDIGASSIDYHVKAISRATVALAEARAMTDAEAEQCAEDAYNDALTRYAESVQTAAVERGRYAAMIEKVNAWSAPTPEHENLKAFMLQQLKMSIDFDCGYIGSPPARSTGAAYKADSIRSAERDLAYHMDELSKARANTDARKAWLRSLIASVSE